MGIFSSSDSRATRRLKDYEKELNKRGARALARYEDELDSAGDKVRNRLKGAGDQIGHRWHQARDRVEDEGQRAWELTEEGARDLDRHVHENAWSYIGAGAAIGLVAGLLLGRRF
ncbi:DUF883 family protein [Kushneria sp. TE3]|uniref:DUF883 family protein n=1 Tax=Kushneria sp. TE3 TaxID=3449832 RepID=UPI003F686BA1